MSVKTEWIWNKPNKARFQIKKGTYINVHNEKEPLNLETDV